jgi:hypothetical protein
MKPKVYFETTVLSYLARPSKDPITAGRQVLTRRWWDAERSKYQLVVSEAVEVECDRGDPEIVAVRRRLLQEATLFPLNQEILEFSESTDCSRRHSRKGRPRRSPYCGSFSGEV